MSIKYFRNFKTACEYYNYKGSHRIGTIGNEKGVIRSYSNGKNNDKILNEGNEIWYKIKNNKIKELYQKSINSKQNIRFFIKIKNGVLDLGLFNATKFKNGYVILIKK